MWVKKKTENRLHFIIHCSTTGCTSINIHDNTKFRTLDSTPPTFKENTGSIKYTPRGLSGRCYYIIIIDYNRHKHVQYGPARKRGTEKPPTDSNCCVYNIVVGVDIGL